MRYSDPFKEVIDEIASYWESEDDVFGRVCAFMLKRDGGASPSYVSEQVECSSNAARKYMDRLAELGILEKNGSTGIHTYRRSRAYLEWRVLLYIGEEYTMDEIIDRVEALEERMGQLSGQMGEIPAIVTASDLKSFEHVGPKMQAANELEQIKRRIRLYELARQVKQNEGHFGFDPIGFWL